MKLLKIFLFVFAVLFSADAVLAQSERKEQRKTERAEKKRLKAEERARNYEMVLDLVQERSFVIEAHSISGGSTRTYQVSPGTNFVMVDGNSLVLQTANNYGIGYNGLGGITIKGKINDYEIISDKGDGISVLIHFSDPVLGHSSLNLDLQESGTSRARLIDSRGRRLNFQGQFVPLENSRVYEGRPII